MGNLVVIKSKLEAEKLLNEHHELINQNDVRQTVQNALKKLNEVEVRIDKIQNKGFIKRFIGGITGSNQKEIVSAMRDISDSQSITIQLIFALAVMHSQDQQALEEILDELDQSKGIYTRITNHIEFLYEKVEDIKETQERAIQKKATSFESNTKGNLKKIVIFGGISIVIFLIISRFI